MPKDGNLNFIDENDTVVVCGMGKGNKSKGDMAQVRMKVIKVSNTSLNALYKGKRVKPKN